MIRRRCSTLLLENRERLRHTRCIHLGKLGGLEVVLLRIILRGNFFDLFTGIFGAHKFGVKIFDLWKFKGLRKIFQFVHLKIFTSDLDSTMEKTPEDNFSKICWFGFSVKNIVFLVFFAEKIIAKLNKIIPRKFTEALIFPPKGLESRALVPLLRHEYVMKKIKKDI